jgi:hypothetical protein
MGGITDPRNPIYDGSRHLWTDFVSLIDRLSGDRSGGANIPPE